MCQKLRATKTPDHLTKTNPSCLKFYIILKDSELHFSKEDYF